MSATQPILDHARIVSGLEEIGLIVGETLQRSTAIRIYGGSALILASNFRTASNDIDYVGNKIRPLPQWMRDTRNDNPENEFLLAAGEVVGRRHRYPAEWFNYHVRGTLCSQFDHHELIHHEKIGSFPAQGPGLDVYLPNLDYILAMKLQAIRIKKEENYKDLRDLLCLIRIKGDEIKNPTDLIEIHARYYMPRQRRVDFEARIEQLWQYHTAGKIPVAVRRDVIPTTPRYLSHACA